MVVLLWRDRFAYECLVTDVAASVRSRGVIAGRKHMRSDNGPEFASKAVLNWLKRANIDTAHIDPE
jgi:putative transposase